jgi:hypothetical protein
MDATLAAWLAAAEGSDAEFAERLWRLVLRREIEAEVRDETVRRLADGVSRATLVHELVTSSEFERVRLLDDAVAWAAAQRRAGARPRGLEAPPGTDERAVARYGERGPAASAVRCAELRHRRLSERARLALRDRRYRDEPRRATA